MRVKLLYCKNNELDNLFFQFTQGNFYKTPELIYIPVLSAQLMTAPTGKPKEIRNFPPADPPRPINLKQFHISFQTL